MPRLGPDQCRFRKQSFRRAVEAGSAAGCHDKIGQCGCGDRVATRLEDGTAGVTLGVVGNDAAPSLRSLIMLAAWGPASIPSRLRRSLRED
jgi:hypothetical protein